MRTITHIVVHCTATSPGASVDSIRRYWRETLKWKSPGYHILVDQFGEAHRLADDSAITNGVAGHNATSLHVSYIGGVDSKNAPKDTRTRQQKETLLRVLREWKRQYPKAIIQGHRDFPGVRKACPSFDAKNEYLNLQP